MQAQTNMNLSLITLWKSRSRILALADPKRPRRHVWREGPSSGEIFRAGEAVKQSGIYEAIHEGTHRSSHEVVMIAEDLFPACETCRERVRFRLVRTAPYIFSDEDFEKQD